MTLLFFIGVSLLIGYRAITFVQGTAAIEKEWEANQPQRLEDFGSTQSLSILPLVNWHTSNDRLKGEAGVSYLIKTDNNTILFDVGFNKHQESPSPLEHNMQQLGITLESIDTIFLSHAHLDHNGGQQWVSDNTFSLGQEQIDLGGKAIYAPTNTTYPNQEVRVIPEATVIAPGVASLGAISRQLLLGRIEEQALVINVTNKGLVLIVGCGHQTVPKILTRTQQVFDNNIYGLVGDLHYPVPEGRITLLGVNLQKYLASGDGPHNPMTFSTMENELHMLHASGLGVMALGGHDTSDEVIARFSQQFGNAYHHVRVGEWIEVAK
ncbi:hypothetical protein A9Q99_26065 [Gammaproteobacteria bacterium 45_16_T64]|nr:hypothetical protein A9Q99_26065 [Gammaproteobacteria bacterium 45_16_T64]